MLLFFISSAVTEERESWNHCMAFARRAYYLLFMIENLKHEIQKSKRIFWNETGLGQSAMIDSSCSSFRALFLLVHMTCRFYFYQGYGYSSCCVIYCFVLQSQTSFREEQGLSNNLDAALVESFDFLMI